MTKSRGVSDVIGVGVSDVIVAGLVTSLEWGLVTKSRGVGRDIIVIGLVAYLHLLPLYSCLIFHVTSPYASTCIYTIRIQCVYVRLYNGVVEFCAVRRGYMTSLPRYNDVTTPL